MMYTIQYTKNQVHELVHEFVHEFVATFWHFVLFSNITNKVEMLANKGFWHFVASCGMIVFRAFLSASLSLFGRLYLFSALPNSP